VANGLAIGGFVVGLNFTVRGGGAVDIAYHAVVPPLLLVSLLALLPGALARRSVNARPCSC
jgi:hypothetical protein